MLHYFDHAATTPVCPEAAQAALEAMTQGFGNPSSGYPLGKAAAQRREADRAVIARALGCLPEELFFTSCGTEGDNWAISAALQYNKRNGSHIVTTAIEHSAVLEPMKLLQNQGYEVTYLKPDKTGHISPEAVKEAIRPDTIFVSIMLVNNETGTILPVKAAAEAIKAAGSPALLHTDGVQGFLKVPFTPKELGADLVTICGHKVRAPKGIGGLYVRKELIPKLKPLMVGGGQERGLRPGTEATAQIAAFAAAVEAAGRDQTRLERTAAIKGYTLEQLKKAVPQVEVISAGDAPHICAISLPGYKSEVVVRVLGDRGICVSSGSACHRGKPSHVFAAMGLPKPWLDGALRLSFSPDSTEEETDALVSALRDAADSLFTTLS